MTESAGVKSAERTLRVLEVLSDGRHRGLAELAAELAVPKSSLHSILRTMEARGWLQADPYAGTYRLGVRSLLAGPAYLDSDDVVSAAGPALDALSASLNETIHLGRLDHTDIIYLAKRESSHPLRLVSAVGVRMPAHATALGKAVLAHRTAAELDRLLEWPLPAVTGRTLTERAALIADLARTAERGHAVDRGESTLGLYCAGVALRIGSPPAYAISCSVPEVRLDPALTARIVAELHAARTDIEAGYRPSSLSRGDRR